MLNQLQCLQRLDPTTYKVVKFMVNVKLMENSVNSHVGSVMVEKVMIQ